MNHTQKELHETALQISQDFKKLEFELIDILQKIDSWKVFLELGYGSVFDYVRLEPRSQSATGMRVIHRLLEMQSPLGSDRVRKGVVKFGSMS